MDLLHPCVITSYSIHYTKLYEGFGVIQTARISTAFIEMLEPESLDGHKKHQATFTLQKTDGKQGVVIQIVPVASSCSWVDQIFQEVTFTEQQEGLRFSGIV